VNAKEQTSPNQIDIAKSSNSTRKKSKTG